MITEQEHEIVPRVRNWLEATSGEEIPTGLSRREARQRARRFLNCIFADHVNSESIGIDGDARDVLWCLVQELESEPTGHRTFEACDHAYQFASAISWGSDYFQEQADILHSIAQIGWRSAAGGIQYVITSRASIWEHGDAQRCHDPCAASSRLAAQIERLQGEDPLSAEAIRDICATLVNLPNARPLQAESLSASLYSVLTDGRQVGHLDDRDFLAGVASFLGGVARRCGGRWDSAEVWYEQAASAFRRTLEPEYLQRIEVERLALQYVRYENRSVIRKARGLIREITIPREKTKARFLLGSAQVGAGHFNEARSTLETVVNESSSTPVLRTAALIKLGAAISGLGLDAEAEVVFVEAARLTSGLEYPLLIGNLAGDMGEHLSRLGRLEEAAALYRTAWAAYRDAGMTSFTAYLAVLLAELLIHLGRNSEAEAELVGALGLMEQCHLDREGIAAVSFLREAIAKRRTDARAVRAVRDQLRKGFR